MEAVSKELLHTITAAAPLLNAISDAEAAVVPQPGKWSRKEILGHLIDSAGNNQQKFVRAMQAPGHCDFTGYAQNFWVESQHYQQADWSTLIALWEQFNRLLAHIIQHTPTEKLENTISIDGSQPFTLKFIMEDYVEHLKHHLHQILPEAGFKSAFVNLY